MTDPHATAEIDRLEIVRELAAHQPTLADTRTPPPGPAPARRPGAGFDRYELLGEVARGGMGVLLRARDTLIGREVVIKLLREEYAGRPAAERRFLREAQINGQLQHPGIVPVYDLGRLPDGRPFLTMRFLHGRTLEHLLAERPDRPRLVRVVEQVAQTVGYAHAKGVIHRDLKPLNVMVSGFGQVRVLDWGLAKLLPAADDECGATTGRFAVPADPAATAFGAAVGTPAYMSPEQARGEPADERADVFGLGGLLTAVLTGHPPYTGSPDEVWSRCQAGDVTEAHARLGGCDAPAGLTGLAVRCLSAAPAGRPRDAGAVARELAAALDPRPWAGVREAVRRVVGL